MNRSPCATVLLIRHATTDAVGQWLAGRTAGVGLNQCGRAQAARLCARLSATDVATVYSSPLERAVETAEPLARERGLHVVPKMELMEVDFGTWTGQRFEQLSADPDWIRFNAHRSAAAVPGGERATEVQARIIRALDDARLRHPNQVVAFVTHADVIRLAILHLAGAPIDFIHRFDVAPASVTAVALYPASATLLYVNDRV